MSKIFFQDFLYEGMTLDKYEYPLIELNYVSFCDDYKEYNSKCSYGINDAIGISFECLTQMTDESDWEKIFKIAAVCKKIYLIDDVPLMNQELDEYKEFLLKTYFYKLKEKCENSFVYKKY